jgi:hypothetical protein
MTKMTLYDVAQEGLIIADILTENDGELTPELEARLDALMQAGPDKIESATMVLKQIEADADACKVEATRLTERAKSFDNNAKRLKERIRVAVDGAFNGKVKTARFTISTQKAKDTVSITLAEGFTPEMVLKDHPELIKTEHGLDAAQAQILWARHADNVRAARAALADPESSDEIRNAAIEALKVIPECLAIEEKEGKRFLRVR